MAKRRPKAKPQQKTIVASKPKLAEAIGRGVRQITEYLQRGMPREEKGYCVEDCRAWIEANIRPTGRGESALEGDEDRGYWETYKVREQALLAEIERRKAEGELVDADEVARQAERRITHAKALLEQVPDRLLGLLPKAIAAKGRRQIRDRAAEMVEDVLAALADAAEGGYSTNG